MKTQRPKIRTEAVEDVGRIRRGNERYKESYKRSRRSPGWRPELGRKAVTATHGRSN